MFFRTIYAIPSASRRVESSRVALWAFTPRVVPGTGHTCRSLHILRLFRQQLSLAGPLRALPRSCAKQLRNIFGSPIRHHSCCARRQHVFSFSFSFSFSSSFYVSTNRINPLRSAATSIEGEGEGVRDERVHATHSSFIGGSDPRRSTCLYASNPLVAESRVLVFRNLCTRKWRSRKGGGAVRKGRRVGQRQS